MRPGTSTPWKKPAVANRHVASSSANCLTSAGLGRSRWVRIGTSTASRTASAAASIAFQLVNSASVRPPAAAISAISSSCDGVPELRRRRGRAGASRSTGAPGVVVVERAADVGLGRCVRPASPTRVGQRRSGSSRWSGSPCAAPRRPSLQHRADVERGDLEARVVAAARHERRRSPSRPPRATSMCSIARR